MKKLLLSLLLLLAASSSAGAQAQPETPTLWAYGDGGEHHYVGTDLHTVVYKGWCVADGYRPQCSVFLHYWPGWFIWDYAGAHPFRVARPDVCNAMHWQGRSCDDESWQWCGNEDLNIEAGWRQDCVGIVVALAVMDFPVNGGIDFTPWYSLTFVAANGTTFEYALGANPFYFEVP